MTVQMVSIINNQLELIQAYSIPTLISKFRNYLDEKHGHIVWHKLRGNEIFSRLVDHYNFISSESVFNEIVHIVSHELQLDEALLMQYFSFFLFNKPNF